MPIIEPVHDDSPLSQGDLLRDIKLFLTGKTDAVDGGESAVSKSGLCLVMSRPCVIAHKASVVVAAVDKMPSQTPKEISTFDEARHFLENLRDGADQPDVFYLGHLTGKEPDGRYAARFDSIHTVYVPSEPAKRKAFTAKHRFAKLQPDFCRDLHTRFFKAFTSLGFDDLSWFSTADLTYLIQMGSAEAKLLDAEKDQVAAATQAAGGKPNEVKKLENRIQELAQRMSPYVAELNRRKSLGG